MWLVLVAWFVVGAIRAWFILGDKPTRVPVVIDVLIVLPVLIFALASIAIRRCIRSKGGEYNE